MANLVLTKNISLDELSAFLKSEMPKYAVKTKVARVWVTRNIFQGCYVKPKTEGGTTTLYFSGDMPGLGRLVVFVGLILLASIVYALTEVLVGAGLIVILGIVALRKLPSSAIAGDVGRVLDQLSGEPESSISAFRDNSSSETPRSLRERCPHCGADVLFVTNVCPSCQKERQTP